MAQSECNIGVGKGTSPFVLCPDKRLCGNALDSHRNANLPWPSFSKGDKRGILQVPAYNVDDEQPHVKP
jgi:hypothetical protein